MPRYALQLLQRRLERAHLLDQAASDARILFRKRLRFLARDDADSDPAGDDAVQVEMKVGAVHLGWLSLSPGPDALERDAYRRWLKLVANDLSEHLSSPHGHGREVLPSRIAEAAQIIRDQHREPLSLGDVAEAVGLSRERLSRLFHESLGITFSEYLNHARLETARALLAETDRSVTDVAFESGFQSLSQFHRRFRTSENKSPSQYRIELRP